MKKHLGEAEFTSRCIEAFTALGFKATRLESLKLRLERGDYDAEHAFRNLYQSHLLEDPAHTLELIGEAAARLDHSLSEAARDRQALSLDQALGLLYPMIRAEAEVGAETVRQGFADELVVVYAVDLPTAWRFVDDALLGSWGLSLEALHQRAVDNLEALTAQIEPLVIPGKVSMTIYAAGDGFDAARALLLERLHPDVEAFTFAMPTRDQLLYIPDGWLPQSVVEALRMQVEQEHHAMDRPLSPEVWRWTAGGTEPVPLG